MADRQKILLLTGASRGIGHATVKRFSSEGWRVLTCSRQPFDPRCPWPGGADNHIQIDLADPGRTIDAIAKIKDLIGGKLDALVNNAGTSPKGPLGVRVNAIAPGEVDTAILSPGTDKIVERLPLRRLGTTAEVAETIWFLCTAPSSYITGTEIHINGGQHV